MYINKTPTFSEIKDIYVDGKDIFLCTCQLSIDNFIEHLQAFHVSTAHATSTHLINLGTLVIPNPMHLHRSKGRKLVILPHHVDL